MEFVFLSIAVLAFMGMGFAASCEQRMKTEQRVECAKTHTIEECKELVR